MPLLRKTINNQCISALFTGIALLCYAGMPSIALAKPEEQAKRQLNDTLRELKSSQENEQKLSQLTATLEKELASLQQEMVKLARRKDTKEQELLTLEEKLTILVEQQRTKQQALDARQQELSGMMSAMIKLRQMPPAAVIAMPGKLQETLSVARALAIITHAIEEESESLKAQLKELAVLQEKVEQNRHAVLAQQQSILKEEEVLAGKLKERTALQSELYGKQRDERKKLQTLHAKSRSLQDLLASLDKQTIIVPDKASSSSAGPLASLFAHQGKLRLPAGKTTNRYGQSSSGSVFSKGLLIETRPRATVLALAAGEVVYAGSFRDYGNMIIIRHGEDTHSLLAGMEKISVAPGQRVLAGEPVGGMGEDPLSSPLYVELRNQGKAMNPAGWFKK